MRYRVVYTEVVVQEVVFDGPPGLQEDDFFETMNEDANADVRRLDVTERDVNLFKVME
jgi:hypothetical protein